MVKVENYIKMGFVRIEGEDGAIYTRYFSFRGLDNYKEKVIGCVKEFVEYDDLDENEKKTVDEFIEQELTPNIEHAWKGGYVVYPVLWDYQVIFGIHNIDADEVEEAVWQEIFRVWDRFRDIKVPENKREDVEEALADYGYIAVSDGTYYAVRIYLSVDEDGWIVLQDGEGEQFYIEDIYEHDYIYDPFGLLRWLKEGLEEVKNVIGGENDVGN